MLTLSNLRGHAARNNRLEHEDEALPAKDNGFSEELQLLESFTFFEIIHRMAYVNATTLAQR